MTMTIQPTAEQWLSALDREIQKLVQFQKQIALLPPVEQQKAMSTLREHQEQIKKIRISALGVIKPGDVHSLTRVIGVPHAYPVFMELGVGSLQALVSCTRKQFQKLARPPEFGWTGGANDMPPQADEQLVIEVSGVLASLGLRWREPASPDGKRPAEKPKIRLPEPVLSKEFNPSFDPTPRFAPDAFDGYGKPAFVRGVPGKWKSIVEELALHGAYSWDDLTRKTAGDLIRSGVHRIQVQIIQYEMRRRGLLMLREEKPSLVYQDLFDLDKHGAREFLNKDTGQMEKTEGIAPEDLVAKAEEGRVLIRADVIKTAMGAEIVGVVVKETDFELQVKVGDGKDSKVLSIPKNQILERKKAKKIIGVIDVADSIQDRIDIADSEYAEDAGDGVYLEAHEKENAAPPEEVVVIVPQADQGVAFPSTSPSQDLTVAQAVSEMNRLQAEMSKLQSEMNRLASVEAATKEPEAPVVAVLPVAPEPETPKSEAVKAEEQPKTGGTA